MAMLSKTVKTQTRTFDDGTTALDIRVWRKFEGARDLRPGKGLSLTYNGAADLRAQANALIAGIEAEAKRVERAEKRAAKLAA